MGSSKCISARELFCLIFLFQQSGLFWLLPYFLVRENGTIGLSAIFPGIAAAVIIILVCHYWSRRVPECGFVTALQQQWHVGGTVIGMVFFLFYLLFAIVTLYSFIDVTQKQLLEQTPQLILCATVLLVVGWMSWNGLESIARMTVLCVGVVAVQVVLSVVGSVELFAIENMLPLQVKNTVQLQEAIMHSIFCYSGLLVLFMVYPARNRQEPLTGKLLLAIGVGAVMLILWTAYALGVLGEYSLQAVLWIPIQLARMVQISSLLEQTEALFVVLWMCAVIANGSLLVWCASESIHQLLRKQKSVWVHGSVLLLVLGGMAAIRNSMRFMEAEHLLAQGMLYLLPVLLIVVILLASKRRDAP